MTGARRRGAGVGGEGFSSQNFLPLPTHTEGPRPPLPRGHTRQQLGGPAQAPSLGQRPLWLGTHRLCGRPHACVFWDPGKVASTLHPFSLLKQGEPLIILASKVGNGKASQANERQATGEGREQGRWPKRFICVQFRPPPASR